MSAHEGPSTSMHAVRRLPEAHVQEGYARRLCCSIIEDGAGPEAPGQRTLGLTALGLSGRVWPQREVAGALEMPRAMWEFPSLLKRLPVCRAWIAGQSAAMPPLQKPCYFHSFPLDFRWPAGCSSAW